MVLPCVSVTATVRKPLVRVILHPRSTRPLKASLGRVKRLVRSYVRCLGPATITDRIRTACTCPSGSSTQSETGGVQQEGLTHLRPTRRRTKVALMASAQAGAATHNSAGTEKHSRNSESIEEASCPAHAVLLLIEHGGRSPPPLRCACSGSAKVPGAVAGRGREALCGRAHLPSGVTDSALRSSELPLWVIILAVPYGASARSVTPRGDKPPQTRRLRLVVTDWQGTGYHGHEDDNGLKEA